MACFIQVHLYTILLFTVVCVSLQIIVKFAFLEHTSGKWTQQSCHLQTNIQTISQKKCTKAAVMWTTFSVFCNCKLCFTCKNIINKFLIKHLKIDIQLRIWNSFTWNQTVFVCLFFLVYPPTWEFFTHMETSTLPVKDCKFWSMLGTHGHWAVRVL